MKKSVLFILALILVSLHVLGQSKTEDNAVLFEDNDVDFMGKCTEDYPYRPFSEFNGDTTAFLKANFSPGGDRVCFGFTNRTVKALVDTMRKDMPVRAFQLCTNRFGNIVWILLYFDTPEKIYQKVKEGKEVEEVDLLIPHKTSKKRTETIKKYIAIEKLLEWDDKYLKVLGGITYEYAIKDFTYDLKNPLLNH